MTSQTSTSKPAPRRHQHPRKRAKTRAKLRHQKSESFSAKPPQASACKPFSEAKTSVNLFYLFIATGQRFSMNAFERSPFAPPSTTARLPSIAPGALPRF